jgi:hypothetical protein
MRCPVGYSYQTSYKNDGRKIDQTFPNINIRTCRNKCDDNTASYNQHPNGCRAFGYSYNTRECLLFGAIVDPDTETPGYDVYCTKGKLYKSNLKIYS